MTRKEWYDDCLTHGTRGDQVHHILQDWKNEQEAINQKIDGLVLDMYPLTIANGSIDAGEQRRFADDVIQHLKALRAEISYEQTNTT